MLRVGLTGGIACGKSHVLRGLAQRGFDTLDLDEVARGVTAPGGAAHDEVVAAFGPRVLDAQGEIDRKALAAIVFADAAVRARLNAIVHPRVRQEVARWAAAARASVLVTDGALLVEAGVHLRFDRLIVVHCGPDEQRRRLRERDGLDDAAARARVAAQMPIKEKRRFAHFEVNTSGSLADTHRAADALAGELAALASAPRVRIDVPRDRALGGLLHGPASGPRGLDPAAVMVEIASAGGLEMERMARRLVPPSTAPWYQAAGRSDPSPGPETLAVPLVLWALARPPDPPFLASAAASLARLTHRGTEAIATAIAFALALQETAVAARVPSDLDRRLKAWASLTERWAGGLPSDRLHRVFDAAGRHPTDPSAARGVLRAAGPDADLAGALVGLAVGASPEGAPAPLLEALARLGAKDGGEPRG